MGIEISPSFVPEAARPATFEEQMGKIYEMEVGEKDKTVDYIRLCPAPEKLSSKEPIIFLLGFSEDPKTHEGTLKAMYNEGFIIFCLTSYPRQELDIRKNGHPRGLAQNIEVASELIQEARSFDPDNPDEKTAPQGKVTIIGRSMGGVVGAYTTADQPENISNLLLIDTKLTAPENPFHLAFNFTASGTKAAINTLIQPSKNKHVPHVTKNLLKYITGDLGMTIDEINTLANSDIRPILPKLREQGVGVHGIHGTSDQVFPIDDAQKDISQTSQETDKKLFDIFLTAGQKRNPNTPTSEELRYTPDYTPIDHGSLHNNEKYIKLLICVLKAARAKSEKKANL